MRRFLVVLLTLLLALGIAASLGEPLAAQRANSSRRATFLLLKGADTLVVERTTRTAGRALAVIAIPGQPRIELDFQLDPDGGIPSGSLAAYGFGSPPDATPLQKARFRFTADSVFVEVETGGSTRKLSRAVSAGTYPVANNDFILFEQAIRRARARGVTSLDVPLFALANGQSITGTVALIGKDSATFTIGNNVTRASIDAEGFVTGGFLPGQGITIAVVTGAATERISLGKPNYGPPAGAPYTGEEVVVTTPAGHQLSGTLTLPASRTGRIPAIITITGSGQQDRDEFIPVAGGFRLFRQVADTLGRRGIATLRLDDRGIGGSGGDVNGTSADFADDIRAALAWLRTRPEIDPDRIALVGHSEGGLIAPMIGASDRRLAALVLMAGPAYTGRKIIDFQIKNGVVGSGITDSAKRDSTIKAQLALFDSTSAKQPWMKFFLSHDPIPTARKIKQPVLILQGATDQQVTPEQAELLEQAIRRGGNSTVSTIVFPERNHLFLRDPVGFPGDYAKLTDSRVDPEVLGALADWLAATLRP